MVICFIIASYLSIICLIIHSYMRHGWIWWIILDTGINYQLSRYHHLVLVCVPAMLGVKWRCGHSNLYNNTQPMPTLSWQGDKEREMKRWEKRKRDANDRFIATLWERRGVEAWENREKWGSNTEWFIGPAAALLCLSPATEDTINNSQMATGARSPEQCIGSDKYPSCLI